MTKAIFFDRDGVLNKNAAEHEYITKWSDFKWNEWAKEILKTFHDKWFPILIITNQQGIAKWKYSLDDLNDIHTNMQEDLKKIWVKIQKIYFCPHLKEDNCNCRKPNTWMLEQAFKDYNLDKEKCLLIWDSDSDIACAKKFWIKYVKVEKDKIKNHTEEIEKILETIQ